MATLVPSELPAPAELLVPVELLVPAELLAPAELLVPLSRFPEVRNRQDRATGLAYPPEA